jgi:phosphate transport system substrate-binding protein
MNGWRFDSPRTLKIVQRKHATVIVAAALASAFGLTPALAQNVTLDKNVTVNGAGSSFMSNFMEQCKADVKNQFGINVAYQPTGSGAGRSGFISGTLDWAGSDVPFTAAEEADAKKHGFVYVPITSGGIAVIYRIPGVTDLKLSGQTLAKIFAGQVQMWNDDAITRENSGVKLPNEVIRVIVRSDSSGTSNVFSDYLASAGKGGWSKGTTSNFPVPAGNGVAQKGSDGVANYVAGEQGNFAITYAETSFAAERKLSVVKVINTAGNAVLPEPANVTEAISAAAVNDDGTLLLNFNAPGPKAYPVSTTAYAILPTKIDANKGDVLRTFATYSLGACQKKAEKAGYAALPANIVKLGLEAVAKVNPGSGPVPTVAGGGGTDAAPTTVGSGAGTTVAKPAITAAGATTVATPTTKPVKPVKKKGKK